MKEILRNKNATMLWFSRTFSRFGDAFESLALMYLIYELTGSALAMGTVMIFSVVPNVMISPIAGVLGDKYNKKFIMATAEIVRTLSILTIPVLHILGKLQLWNIYLIAVLVSSAESFFEPCAQVTMVSVLKQEQLPVYNSLVTTSNQIAKMLGYALSGIVMRLISMNFLFLIDAITFMFSALTILCLSLPKADAIKGVMEEKSEGIIESLKEAVRYVSKMKVIPVILITIAFDAMLIVPITEFLPQVSKEIFHQNETLSGYIMTILSIGTIVGSILYPVLLKMHIKLKQFLLIGNLMIGAVLLGSLWFNSMIAGLLIYIVTGITISAINIWCSTELQCSCKIEYMGRVSALFSIIMVVSDPLSATISGWAIDMFSIKTVFICTAMLFIVLGCILYLLYRNADKQEEIANNQNIQPVDA